MTAILHVLEREMKMEKYCSRVTNAQKLKKVKEIWTASSGSASSVSLSLWL